MSGPGTSPGSHGDEGCSVFPFLAWRRQRDENCRLYRDASTKLAEVARERDEAKEALLTLYAAVEELVLSEHEHDADAVAVHGRLVRARQAARRALGV